MQAMQSSHTLFLMFTIAVVISVIVQAAVFVAIFVVVFRNIGKLRKVIERLAGSATPAIAEIRGLVQDVSPKVRTISSHVVDITSAVREQTLHVNTTVDEVVDKTRAQANKVDDMVSAVLGSIAHAGSTVQSGVTRPVRKVGGLLHGIRVGVETLFNSETNRAATATNHRTAPVSASVPDPVSQPGAAPDGEATPISSRVPSPPETARSEPFRTEVRTTVLDQDFSKPTQTIQPPPTTRSPR